MTAIGLIIGFGIGWLLCGIIMKRAHKRELTITKRIYQNQSNRAIRQDLKKTSKNKNQ